MYLVLALNYLKMASSEDWVHTDPLAFGGPRPVYTLRYLERSICISPSMNVPCLLSLRGPWALKGLLYPYFGVYVITYHRDT